jgi:hypothetical protein
LNNYSVVEVESTNELITIITMEWLSPIQEIEKERMSSVTIDILDNDSIDITLKSILKKSENTNKFHPGLIFAAVKACAILAVLLHTPIIIGDLYFGFADTSCVHECADGFELSMKTYLIVSAFVAFSTTLCIISLTFVKNINLLTVWYIKIVGIIHLLFCFTWNVLGGIIFWGTILPNGKCSRNVSTYIYVTLVIKIIVNLFSISVK